MRRDDGSTSAPVEPRERILRAAAQLLDDGGREALTTRAIEAAADVQAPTIYRLFGDKRGLVDAVAEARLEEHVAAKAAAASEEASRDPVEVLRDAWWSNVEFALENPALYALTDGDPRPDRTSALHERGIDVLRARVERIALAGRLTVPEERAVDLILASGRGVVLTLLATPEEKRDPAMPDDALDGLIASITTDGPPRSASDLPAAANALRAAIRGAPDRLSRGEAALLDELLARLGQPPRSG